MLNTVTEFLDIPKRIQRDRGEVYFASQHSSAVYMGAPGISNTENSGRASARLADRPWEIRLTETAILYIRDDSTTRNSFTYPKLIDELKSSYIYHENKIVFETRIKQFEGFQMRYRNKIRSHTHINTEGRLSQKNLHYGLDAYDVDIFGNFKTEGDADKLSFFAEENQTPKDFPDGIVGLYVLDSTFLNIDPIKSNGVNRGYTIESLEIGRVLRLKEIWDFRVTLRFGGVL